MTIFNDLCISFNNQADKDNLLIVFLCRTSLPEVNPLWAVRGFVFFPFLIARFLYNIDNQIARIFKNNFIYLFLASVGLPCCADFLSLWRGGVTFSGGAWMGFLQLWSTGPRAHGLSSRGRRALVPGLSACSTRA